MNRTGWIDRLRQQLPAEHQREPCRIVQRLYSFIIPSEPVRPGTRFFYQLIADDRLMLKTLDENVMLDSFISDVGKYVASAAPHHIFVHAGVVEWEGRAIVIPGPSLTGKTTLVRAFLKLGARYYSDEFAVFNSRGLVCPFARPLGVRDKAFRQLPVAPQDLGAVIGSKPIAVRAFLFTRYVKGARWRPKAISPAEAALQLLANTLSIRERTIRSMNTLAKAIKAAQALEGTRGPAAPVAASLCSSDQRSLHGKP